MPDRPCIYRPLPGRLPWIKMVMPPSATFYKWKAKFGGLDVSDARRLKALEDENGKLKKLLAETMLDIAILKDINSRKW